MSTTTIAAGATPPGQARRFAAALFLVSIVYGLHIAFLPLWLDARGLSVDQIGYLLALPTAAVVVFNPLVCAYADRRQRIAASFVASAVAVAITHLTMAFSPDIVTLFLAAGAMALARAPLLTLADALTLAMIARDPRIDYGRMRIWCSLAVLFVTGIGGFVVERMAPQNIIWLLVAGTGAGAAAALAFTPRDVDRPRAAPADASAPLVLPDRTALVAVIASAALTQASHALIYAFGSLHWRESGASGGFIGLVWAIGVAAEILLFAVASRLAAQRRAPLFLTLGAGFAAARWMLMALDPAGLPLMALATLHAGSFGATHLGSLFLMARLAPAEARARAQGWLSAATGLALMAATAASGPLWRSLGPHAYWIMAAMAVAAMALAMWAARRLAQPQSAGSGG